MKQARSPSLQLFATRIKGTTLVELLASMAILSVLLVVLGSTLEVALGRFRSGVERTENHGGAQLSANWIERDLSSHATSRPANLPRLPVGVTSAQREFFEQKLLLPFELNRVSGTGIPEARSFQNAAPEFASLAFVNRQTVDGGLPGEGGLSIVGYYVAYARNSPLSGDDGAGMKLFRHFRRGGSHYGDGYAGGLLRYCSLEINDAWDEASSGAARPVGSVNPAAVRGGRFENADLPFLLSRRFSSIESTTPVAATQPWPVYPIVERLISPPPTLQPDRGTEEAWENPSSAVHDSVFPDELICDHVVRFELTPFLRVETAGRNPELMDAGALNRHLGLAGGKEWPVLAAPDLIELVITTVSEKAALTLRRYEDWLIDWENEDSGSWSPQRQLIEREMQTFRFRLQLPPRSR